VKLYIREETRPPLAVLAANNSFHQKRRETFKGQVLTLLALFKNSHVSRTIQNQYNVYTMNHLMQWFVI